MGAIGYGPGLWLRQRRRGGAFDPTQLFAAGEQGAWYDPSDLSTLFQDGAGTIPAALDAPVGRMVDKSGRANHAVQESAGARPILRQDGAGKLYLQFDGGDDWLRALFAIAQPFERVSAMRHVAADGNSRHIFGGGTTASGVLFHHAPVPSLSLASPVTAATRTDFASGATAVVTERFDGAASRLAVNLAAYTGGSPGAGVPGGITIAGRHDGVTTGASALRFYGLVMRAGTMSGGQIAQLRHYLAGKAGVAL